ncbi:MAG TPA: hypothetical protein VG938_14630 [Verrucomicrobiae bacterium]|jgi:hypothetical protein|nr:hypothetical protein [Verrucomicrobiae bacterium]
MKASADFGKISTKLTSQIVCFTRRNFAMWTCPKCGEAVEDQFGSCWKCAKIPREPVASARPSLRWSDYLLAALIAYLIPLLAVFLQPGFTNRYEVFLGRELFHDARAWLWMLVPAAIDFAILLPFLKSPGSKRAAAVFLLFAWVCIILSTSMKMH